MVYLAEQFAHPVDYLTETLHAPQALSGMVIAVLVATPEAIGATRAALANQMQRSVNIFLGSVLSTIGLTVPAMLIVSNWTHHPIILGVEHGNIVLLVLTLGVSILTFASGRTNVLQGLVHLLLLSRSCCCWCRGEGAGTIPLSKNLLRLRPSTRRSSSPFRVPPCRPPCLQHR